MSGCANHGELVVAVEDLVAAAGELKRVLKVAALRGGPEAAGFADLALLSVTTASAALLGVARLVQRETSAGEAGR